MMKHIIYIIIILTLIGCSPTRRLNNLLEKHPELITNVVDTIHYRDTIIYMKPKTDYNIPIILDDSFHFETPDYNLTYYIPSSLDTFYLEIDPIHDTIYIDKEIYVDRDVLIKSEELTIKQYLLYFGIFIILLLILYVILKAMKK